MEDIRKKIEDLRAQIIRHNHLYYDLSDPEIADTDYDDLYRELLHLEQEYPQFDDPKSPTKMVGGKVLDKLSRVRHRYPITSLDKAYITDEVTTFYMSAKNRADKFTREEFSHGYIIEPKYDGLTLVLHYRDGVLIRAVTRGDGLYGNDVTHNARVIANIPQKLNFEVQNLVVRGEAVIPKREFERLNEEQRRSGDVEFKSARNLVSGSMQQLDSKVTAKRGIKFIPYEILNKFDEQFDGEILFLYGGGIHKIFTLKTYEQEIKFLKKLGFETNDGYKKIITLDEIYKTCCVSEHYQELWNLPYDIDGFVIKLNSLRLRHEFGNGHNYPYWQVAFKLPQKRYKTHIRSVEWGIGKTGAITPVAVFDTVRIDGTDVTRATLHNVNEISRLGLRIGSLVMVEKAGGIIPAIIESIPEADTEHYKDIEIIKECPVCGSPTSLSDTGLLKCTSQSCEGTFVKRLIYFVGKKGLDIDGFGDKLCESLVENEMVSTFSDIFKLTISQLKPLIGNKLSEKILDEIKSKRSVSFAKFLAILQIPNIGQTNSKLLADNFKTLEELQATPKYRIEKIPNLGPVAANSVFNFLRIQENIEEINNLLNYLSIKEDQTSDKLKGTFCITGTLSQPRPYFEKLINQNGGKISGTVGKKLDYLLLGADSGSKEEKARELGIKIISEREFMEMLK